MFTDGSKYEVINNNFETNWNKIYPENSKKRNTKQQIHHQLEKANYVVIDFRNLNDSNQKTMMNYLSSTNLNKSQKKQIIIINKEK